MQTNINDIIALAKFYADADDVVTDGVYPDSRLLQLANFAFRETYRRVVRAGLLSPTLDEDDFTAAGLSNYTVDVEPIAILAVVEVDGDNYRELRPATDVYGRRPLLSTEEKGPANWWWATLSGTSLTVHVRPLPTSGVYRVYSVAVPPKLVTGAPGAGESNTLDLPAGLEERVALGVARGCLGKGRSRSGFIESRIQEIDTELEMTAAARRPARVRNRDPELRGWRRRGQDSLVTSTTDGWLWL